jgi:hypothetical protein
MEVFKGIGVFRFYGPAQNPAKRLLNYLVEPFPPSFGMEVFKGIGVFRFYGPA